MSRSSSRAQIPGRTRNRDWHRLDHRKSADGEKACRVEEHERERAVMTLRAHHPRLPAAVETEAQFCESAPRAAARIPPAPPPPATRADPELRRSDEAHVSTPE